jgi:3-oxoacyl-(acyl-carrier-protein) synthase
VSERERERQKGERKLQTSLIATSESTIATTVAASTPTSISIITVCSTAIAAIFIGIHVVKIMGIVIVNWTFVYEEGERRSFYCIFTQ